MSKKLKYFVAIFSCCIFFNMAQAKELECRTIIKQELSKQFEHWRNHKGINKILLDNVSKMPKDVQESFQINRLQFIDGEFFGDVHASWGSAWDWMNVISLAHAKNPIENFDAIFILGDGLFRVDKIADKYNDIVASAPVFHINKLKAPQSFDQNVLLLPADYAMNRSLQKIYQDLDQAEFAWHDKKILLPGEALQLMDNIASTTLPSYQD